MPLGIRDKSGEERGWSYCVSPMVGWVELVATNGLKKFSIPVSRVHSWLYCSCVEEFHSYFIFLSYYGRHSGGGVGDGGSEFPIIPKRWGTTSATCWGDSRPKPIDVHGADT